MYQKIDDIEEMPVKPQATPSNRRWLLLVAAILFSIIVGATIWTYTQKSSPLSHSADQPQTSELFQRIQAEPRKSVRRARLIDFTQTYPEAPMIHGAKQQLRVMNVYEARDWAALSDIMFDDKLSQTDKFFEIEKYVELWGEGLVGSRDEELAAFRATLATLDVTTDVDRKHKPEGSPIPDDIDGTQMAGGHKPPPARPTPVAPPEPPQQPQIKGPEITPLRVRRNRSPDYPRKAYSRRVPATVILSLNIDDRGRVRLVETISVKADRYGRDFERAAVRAARNTRYYPRKEDGIAVPIQGVRKTYVFDPEQ
ncbi:MAG: TonB family protein [Maricaulaceae bacterium]